MLTLAIDTSGDVAGIALATESAIISELTFRHRMNLLQRLMPNIDRLVSDAGHSRTDLEGVAISLGPGSFTGLRIGMAAAKSIAHVLNIPIAGISTFDILAHGASAARPKSIATLIHSRPGDVYWAIHSWNPSGLVRRREDRLSSVKKMVSEAKREADVVFCGDGAAKNRALLVQEFGEANILDDWFNTPRAAVLARLGIARISAGDYDDVMTLAPSYVQRPTPVVRLGESEWD